MRYLDLPHLYPTNAILRKIPCEDGSCLLGRLEAYSCTSLFLGKAAGRDKKLLKEIEQRMCPTNNNDDGYSSGMELTQKQGPLIFMTPKLLHYLVSILNLVFPDHDFSGITPNAFTFHLDLTAVIKSVNSSLSWTHQSTNHLQKTAICRRVWEALDVALGGLEETTAVLSFAPDALELDDPFREDPTTMYSNLS